MKLTIKDRIVLSGLYPKEGDMLTQILIREIGEKTRIGSEEAKEIELKTSAVGVTWNVSKATEKEIEFTNSELRLLKERVSKLDKEKKITQEMLDLCVKIQDAQK